MKRHALFALLLGLALSAAAPAGAQSLGVGAGIVKLENDDAHSLFLTGNLRFKLLGPIVLEPEVGYWKRTETIPAGELKFEDFSVGGNALLVFPGRSLSLWGGAGLGWHFLDRSAGIAGLLHAAKSTDAAVHVLAGVDVRVSNSASLFATARKDVFGNDTDSRDQTKFYGGLRFTF